MRGPEYFQYFSFIKPFYQKTQNLRLSASLERLLSNPLFPTKESVLYIRYKIHNVYYKIRADRERIFGYPKSLNLELQRRD